MAKSTFNPEHSPTVWFCVLERAIRGEDYQTAQRATRRLKRLGVDVRFHPSRMAGTGK